MSLMQNKLPIGIALVGVLVVVVAAIVGFAVIPKVIDNKIADQTQLKEGSETLEKWADVPYPIFLTFRVFHVKNADEVEAGGKPILEEKGPYVYSQRRLKLNMSWSDTPDNTIQYVEQKIYFFNEELSEGNTENDVVDIINIPFVAVVHGVHSKAPGLTGIVANQFLGSERLVRRGVKVGELFFSGFDVSTYTNNPFLGLLLPEEFSGGRFGLYKGENESLSEVYNIYSGVDDPDRFGIIKTYAGNSTLGFWKLGTPCDDVRGTDGSVYPPYLKKDRKIDVFSTDLCRSLTFTYSEDTEHNDIPAYRFTVPKWTLEDPRINPDNQCYCLEDNVPDDCPHGGTISLESCRNGAPITMSTPYFLDADQSYWEAVTIPKADPEKHVTYLDIEPHSGVLLRGHKRIQVNVEVRNFPGVNAYKNLKSDIIFPLVWADESAEMDTKSSQEIKDQLLKPLKIVNIAKWTLIGVGIAVFIAGVALFVIRRRQSKVTV